MATLDEIRLEQLLKPFENQNTGVMSTNNALPFINTGQVNQQLQNTDLVNQLIQENQMKANMFSRPNMMNVAGTSLPGGITEIKNQMIEELPPKSLGFNTLYGVANTPNVIGEQSGLNVYESDDGRAYYIDPDTGQEILAPGTVEAYKRQSGYSGKKPSGIAKLFEFLGNIPTPMNILRGGLESLRGFNKKIRGTTFALSPTLKDYVQAKRAEKRAAAGADVGVSGGGRGSRRGDADISGPRGGFATDDTAGFF